MLTRLVERHFAVRWTPCPAYRPTVAAGSAETRSSHAAGIRSLPVVSLVCAEAVAQTIACLDFLYVCDKVTILG
jgi:hypothetical protein